MQDLVRFLLCQQLLQRRLRPGHVRSWCDVRVPFAIFDCRLNILRGVRHHLTILIKDGREGGRQPCGVYRSGSHFQPVDPLKRMRHSGKFKPFHGDDGKFHVREYWGREFQNLQNSYAYLTKSAGTLKEIGSAAATQGSWIFP